MPRNRSERAARAPFVLLAIVASTSFAGCSFDSSGAAGTGQLGDGFQDATPHPNDADASIAPPHPDVGLPDLGADLAEAPIDEDVAPDDDAGTDVVDVPDVEDAYVAEVDSTSGDVLPDAPDVSEASVAPDVATVPCTELGAQTFGGHCYFVLTAAGWGDAKDDCASKSPPAHLVVITSSAEESFVAGLTGLDAWIGLSAPATTTTAANFAWVDGEPVGYTDWASGEPNGTGPCVANSTGSPPVFGGPIQWHDRDCSELDVPICERE